METLDVNVGFKKAACCWGRKGTKGSILLFIGRSGNVLFGIGSIFIGFCVCVPGILVVCCIGTTWSPGDSDIRMWIHIVVEQHYRSGAIVSSLLTQGVFIVISWWSCFHFLLFWYSCHLSLLCLEWGHHKLVHHYFQFVAKVFAKLSSSCRCTLFVSSTSFIRSVLSRIP